LAGREQNECGNCQPTSEFHSVIISWQQAHYYQQESRSRLVGPAIRSLQLGADMIDLTSVVEIVSDQDANDHARGQMVARISEAFALSSESSDGYVIQFCLIPGQWTF